ncbi:hypothetical protein PLEOSDRAFT_1073814 [Pleurotus ostreatus PC15]|uniref:DDE-1 domain-containing protein n=1 Tax=Pleurotus ostreatus (strain PC15) TaxID=1137138 RepID=A0A067NZV6_PLEO1|nr:hypothetical protein PLEOSDRAFT_1073814 [Pleurotus ostreatus PC15]
MPGRAEPETTKTRKKRKIKDQLYQQAVEFYRKEHGDTFQATPDVPKPRGYEKPRVELAPSTLRRLVNGGIPKSQSNAMRGWLLEGEVEIVIRFAVEMALCGFPLTHRRLKEHVNGIVRARLGDAFPATGVGKNWTDRFTEKHRTRLSTYWSHSLDNKRGRAVNPNTNEAWYDLLEKTLNGEMDHEFDEDLLASANLYGSDESGFQPSDGSTQRVIGPAGRTTQHQQSDGNRDNTTVIVTICADGSSIKPVVIFKGTHYQVRWNQDNPLDASLGHSKKGWTDGEIGVEFIKDFHEQTKAKANERTCVLIVDGHNSHYTLAFLLFARKHRIHILCYPAHATHVYQGLDVVVFGPLKTFWGQEKEKFEREKRQRLNKSNFLAIYGAAHIQALTPENIKAAFRKTGVYPFDRSVITQEMMAPSLETSFRGHLPVEPTTPVRAVTNMLYSVCQRTKALRQSDDTHDSVDNTTPNPFDTPTREVVSSLQASTSASFLISSSPIQSTSQLAPYASITISPRKPRYKDLLEPIPLTILEADLQNALRKLIEKNEEQKDQLVTMQSMLVLNGAYCDVVRGQLEAHEESRKRNKKGRLVGDGLPRLLTGHEFLRRVAAFHKAAEDQEEALKQRRATRAEKSKARKECKELEKERKAQNKVIRAQFQLDLKEWKEEQALAKREHRRPAWTQPKIKDHGDNDED